METTTVLPLEEAVVEDRTPTTDLIVGVAMIVLSIACAVAYSMILRGIYNDKELFRMTSYKFMFMLGVFDVIQCFPHAVTGFFTIYQTRWNDGLAKAMGVLATPCYVGYAVMTVILSFNRFIQLSSPRLDQKLFSPFGVNCWLFCGFLFCFIFAVALSSPYASIMYLPEWYSWDYDYNLSHSWLVQKVEMVIELGGIFVSAIFYGLVLGILYRTRVHFKASKNFHVEIKILVQALVITVYCTVLNFLWHNYKLVLPDNLWSYTALNFMWIFNSGVYPVIYFVVNKSIREKVRHGVVTKVERTILNRMNESNKSFANYHRATVAIVQLRESTDSEEKKKKERRLRLTKKLSLPAQLLSDKKAVFVI